MFAAAACTAHCCVGSCQHACMVVNTHMLLAPMHNCQQRTEIARLAWKPHNSGSALLIAAAQQCLELSTPVHDCQHHTQLKASELQSWRYLCLCTADASYCREILADTHARLQPSRQLEICVTQQRRCVQFRQLHNACVTMHSAIQTHAGPGHLCALSNCIIWQRLGSVLRSCNQKADQAS